MENFYQIFQKQLRMERGFFIKRNMVGVAAVYFSVLKCLEACVGSIVSFQFAVGFVLRLIVLISQMSAFPPRSNTVSKARGTDPLLDREAKT